LFVTEKKTIIMLFLTFACLLQARFNSYCILNSVILENVIIFWYEVSTIYLETTVLLKVSCGSNLDMVID